MRQVILDPKETDPSESEQFVGITSASKSEYQNIEDFVVHSGDHFPFKKIDSPRQHTDCSVEDLLCFIAPITEAWSDEQIPTPTIPGFRYANDWDYKDHIFETNDKFVRVVWTTTA